MKLKSLFLLQQLSRVVSLRSYPSNTCKRTCDSRWAWATSWSNQFLWPQQRMKYTNTQSVSATRNTMLLPSTSAPGSKETNKDDTGQRKTMEWKRNHASHPRRRLLTIIFIKDINNIAILPKQISSLCTPGWILCWFREYDEESCWETLKLTVANCEVWRLAVKNEIFNGLSISKNQS